MVSREVRKISLVYQLKTIQQANSPEPGEMSEQLIHFFE